MSVMLIALLLLAVLVGGIMIITPSNNSACTGNCRQGRDCDCMEKKND